MDIDLRLSHVQISLDLRFGHEGRAGFIPHLTPSPRRERLVGLCTVDYW